MLDGLKVNIDLDADGEAASDGGEFLEGEVAPLVFEACHIAEADVLAVPVLDIPGEAAAGVEEFDAQEAADGLALGVEVLAGERHFHEAAGLLHEGEFLRPVGDTALVDVVDEVGVFGGGHKSFFSISCYAARRELALGVAGSKFAVVGAGIGEG